MRFDSHLNAYQELGVSPDAHPEAIRHAYRHLAFRYHPDRAPEGRRAEYEEKMKRVNAAYDLLSDPKRRAEYDAFRRGFSQRVQHSPASYSQRPRQPRPGAAYDPYERFRQTYTHGAVRIEVTMRKLPYWAQIFTAVFSSAGALVGFLLGLPFGIFGCLPGAVIGFLAGAFLGALLLYLMAILLPVVPLAWLGYLIAQETGLVAGAIIGACTGILWLRTKTPGVKTQKSAHNGRWFL